MGIVFVTWLRSQAERAALSHFAGLRRLLTVGPARIVIVGGGFAGVWAAMGAARRIRHSAMRSGVRITVVSPDDCLVVRPRLYESDLRGVRVPLAPILAPVSVEHVQATVEAVDTERRVLTVSGRAADELGYDQLILCAGSESTSPRGNAGLHSVDTYGRAAALQHAVAALRIGREKDATATVVGAGFAGLEVATELADVLRSNAVAAGRPSDRTFVCLIEAASTVAPGFGARAREVIEEALDTLRVDRRTCASVVEADGRGVTLADGERIESRLTVWAGGPRANRLNDRLALPLDEHGRVPVDVHLATGIDGVWAAGDSARVRVGGRQVAPMSCQHAIPQGRRAGENAAAAVLGQPLGRYAQPLYLTCLDLGSAGGLVTSGFERDVIVARGIQAKRFKRFVNRSLIYPPTSANAVKLLRLGRSSTPGRLGAALQETALRSSLVRAVLIARGADRASQWASMTSAAGRG